ncbi:MAG: GNAT family N-acetyltransferase [Elusimicrobia bacterium]|nr:GNAT family N-acetyltransferase [Elusimicrobiota bacterium]
MEADRPWVLDVLVREWGAEFIVSRGRRVFPARLPGFIAESTSQKGLGLATYEIRDGQCELATLDALAKFSGIGTALLERVKGAALRAGCRRLWLITTNDNLDAIRFYQRRGFRIAAIYKDALMRSRELKPSIPATGQHGIPLRDEIEFEMAIE